MKWSLSEIFASRLRNYPLLRVVLFLSLGIFVGDKLCDLGLLLNETEPSAKAFESVGQGLVQFMLENLGSISNWLRGICWTLVLLPVFIGFRVLKSRKGILHLSAWFWGAVGVAFFSLGVLMVTAQRQKSLVKWEENENVYRVLISSSVVEKAKVYQAEAILGDGAFKGRKVRLSLMKVPNSQHIGQKKCEGVRCISDTVIESIGVDKKGADGVSVESATQETCTRIEPACPKVGDELLCYGRIERPRNAGNPHEFDYAGWLRGQGISGVLFSPDSCWRRAEFATVRPTLAVRMLQFRENLLGRYRQYLDGEELAVLSAMTLGDKSGLNAKVREVFSQTGTSHILALSGLHLGILFFFFHVFVLKHCRRRWSVVLFSFLGISLLWGFAFMAGFPKSLVRATLMFTMMQACGVFSRRSSSLNNLFFAALCILLLSPLALFDIGFQLSCLSVLFILIIMPRLRAPGWVKRFRSLRFVYDLMAVSLCAQLCTAPLVAYYFHTFPIYALFANLLAVPMAYILLGTALLFFCLPFLQSFLGPLLSTGVDVLLQGLDRIGSLPGAVLAWSPSVGIVMGIYALLLLCCSYSLLRRKAFYTSASVVLLLTTVGVYWTEYRSQVRPSIVCYNLNRVPAVHFISSPTVSWVWSPDSARADSALSVVRNNYWRECEISAPAWISERDCLCGEVAKYGEVFSFRSCRVAVAAGPLPSNTPSAPLPIDVLLLCRGYRGEFSPILRFYAPDLVVLDGSLTPYYRRQYKQALQTLGLPMHDMQADGAYIKVLE